MDWIARHPTALAAAAALAILWILEGLYPLFVHRRSRSAHGAQNISLGLINAAVRVSFFPAALVMVSATTERHDFGLLRAASLPSWGVAIAGVLLLDLAGYAWHVASHQWKWLWRFHAVHHHDDAVDSTTAFRFHLGDVLMGSLVTLTMVALLGLQVWHVFLYEVLLVPLSIFHHGNIRIPARLDRRLQRLIVTPRMHWVHHSQWVKETDSNYAPIFSFWDRLFGTFRERRDSRRIRFGLQGYDTKDHATLRGCLTTPLGRIKSMPGWDTARAAPSHAHTTPPPDVVVVTNGATPDPTPATQHIAR